MDDRLYGDKALKDLLPVAILADIPEVVTPSDERSSRKRTVLGWAAAALIIVIHRCWISLHILAQLGLAVECTKAIFN